VVVGLYAISRWQPEWVQSAAVWYFGRCQVLASMLVAGLLHR